MKKSLTEDEKRLKHNEQQRKYWAKRTKKRDAGDPKAMKQDARDKHSRYFATAKTFIKTYSEVPDLKILTELIENRKKDLNEKD